MLKSYLSILTILVLTFGSSSIIAQNGYIRGILTDDSGNAQAYANLGLFSASDSSLIKAELSGDNGSFEFNQLEDGNYTLKVSYVGFEDVVRSNIAINGKGPVELGTIAMNKSSVQLGEATVSAKRSILEVKPDRTVFNVEGTINSIGTDAVSLMRKAPGVTVDNNDNISLLGRSGVLIFIDGKEIPLSGQELANYLQNLQAEQIDRLEIISNPGSKYEAKGNAGIIDIRLKRDKNFGTNGSVSSSVTQGKYTKFNLSSNANYRNKLLNVFANAGLGRHKGYHLMSFKSFQNDLFLNEINDGRHARNYVNFRLGTDFFLSPKHTLGFLVGGNFSKGENDGFNRIEISEQAQMSSIDSILRANTFAESPRNNQTYNINYKFEDGKKRTLNIDADYGYFDNDNTRNQDNVYYDYAETIPLSGVNNSFNTPSDIWIWTTKVDFEQDLFSGKIGLGAKYSDVKSDNTFLVYDDLDLNGSLDNKRSNEFEYREKVAAAYINYAKKINDKIQMSAGLRAEKTDVVGNLIAYLPELQEPPVDLDYLSFFPSAGLTWTAKPKHSFQLNYGRRINRPDYQVLNPFVNQLSQLSFEKGNPFLAPEIVNNGEIAYTYDYRYNFKLGYSKTTDQITRLIGPDDSDPRASFIKWDNIAERNTWSGSASLPFQFSKIWEAYFNVSAAHIHNIADYGDGAVIDLKAFTYSIYQQHSFKLPYNWGGEISGYFSGPGIWGGVFVYETSWSLNLGIQRKFLEEKLNFKLSFNDLFYQSGWSGKSSFDGLESTGKGNFDTRRASISLSYRFGNDKIKSRKRNFGLEDEAGRVGGDN